MELQFIKNYLHYFNGKKINEKKQELLKVIDSYRIKLLHKNTKKFNLDKDNLELFNDKFSIENTNSNSTIFSKSISDILGLDFKPSMRTNSFLEKNMYSIKNDGIKKTKVKNKNSFDKIQRVMWTDENDIGSENKTENLKKQILDNEGNSKKYRKHYKDKFNFH